MAHATNADFNLVESHFFRRVFWIFTGLAIASLLISIAGRQIGSEIAMGGHTDSTDMFEIVIGNDVLSVPANSIRYPEQRRGGIANRLDLYASWPDLRGFTSASKAIFNNQDKHGKLIFISFEQRMMSRDMSGRYEPIYKSMIEGEGEPAVGGLRRYKLPEKAGFIGEYLYVFDNGTHEPFVARCLADANNSITNASCDRDYQAGDGLTMMVRFSPTLLEHWQALDTALSSYSKTALKGI